VRNDALFRAALISAFGFLIVVHFFLETLMAMDATVVNAAFAHPSQLQSSGSATICLTQI
jgi:hypothetical protein